MGQIFAVKMMVEEYLGGKKKKLYAAFMDLEKAHVELIEKLFGMF